MADKPTSLLDLPVDLILLIFPYLDAQSFLSLTSSCTALHKPDFLYESSFWSNIVRNTFRVPNQPVVEADGQRWQKLYKRLLTQSRVMTWGNNEKACLGHSFVSPTGLRTVGPPGVRHARAIRQRHISWPQQMQGTESLGVISDLQCGGWSTSLLTSKGAIYTVGVMDGLQFNRQRPPYMQQAKMDPTPLRFPPGFAQPWERYDPATAVKQFSSGRGHVLALSDNGRIWTWQNIDHAALHVRFIQHDTVESGRGSGRGNVKKVVAGWNKSAALIEGSGIVVWDPLQREDGETEVEDAALVLESAVVPKTQYRESKDSRRTQPQEAGLAEAVGEVLNFIVMEEVIIFNTSLGKAFVSQVFWSGDEQRITEPTEISIPNEDFVTDVQGSFHNFAIFTRSGAVLTSNQDRLLSLWQGHGEGSQLFTRVPALQNSNVIGVAFGDYHFHALHSPGYITSYGNEPQACGALGLGGHGDPEGRLRGIRYQGMGGDGRLVPHAYTVGRRVWFEQEKQDWITFLTSGGVDAQEAAERVRMAIGSPDLTGQGEVSEWVEQEGRDWVKKFGLEAEDEDGLGAYFALSVAAAGWHSGALVLVNEDLANKISKACEVPDRVNLEQEEQAKETAAEPSQPSEEGAQEASNVSSTPSSTSLLSTALSSIQDYGSWFLGVGAYSAPRNADPNPRSQAGAANATHPVLHNGPPDRRAPDPTQYGAAPRDGYRYVWAGDHFPRLRLSDGREMPGNVDFDEWRYGRPGWETDFTL